MSFAQTPAKDALANSQWLYFSKYNTINKFYHFKNSTLFNNLYHSMYQLPLLKQFDYEEVKQ